MSKSDRKVLLWLQNHYIDSKLKPTTEIETYYRNCSSGHLIVILLYLFYRTQTTWKWNETSVSLHTLFFCQQIWEQHDIWVLKTWLDLETSNTQGSRVNRKGLLCMCTRNILLLALQSLIPKLSSTVLIPVMSHILHS